MGSNLTNQNVHLAPTNASEVLRPETTALLVWDLQVGLGGQAINIADLKPKLLLLLAAARQAGVRIVWSRHIAPPRDLMSDTEVWRLMRKQGVSTPGDLQPYMQRGSKDTEFVAGLSPEPGDLVVEKATPSLFVDTEADSRLRAAGIRSIAMTGVATDIGIEFTGRHALALGYFPVVIRDGVGSYTKQANNRGLACVESFAFLVDAEDVITEWKNVA